MRGRYSQWRVGQVPAEPFRSWFFAFRNARIHLFQVDVKTDPWTSRGGINTDRLYRTEEQRTAACFSSKKFIQWLGITMVEYETLQSSRRKNHRSMDIGIIDKIMTGIGRPDLLNEWYPVELFDDEDRWIGGDRVVDGSREGKDLKSGDSGGVHADIQEGLGRAA